MKKRIFINMILLTSISLILVSVTLCFVFYHQFSSVLINELRNRAETFIDNSSETAIEALAITKSSDMRVTIIARDGTVMFDNAAQAVNMPNHLDREEVSNAFETGFGQSIRFSNTLGKETVYYAVRLTDGCVLRTAKTSSSILGVFMGILPVVAGVVFIIVIICYLLAGSLTKRIFAPLNSVNLNSELSAPYDELAPFIKTIVEQRESISQKIFDLQHRSDIINAIMDNINEGIILTDNQGIILSANKSVLRIFEKENPLEGKNTLEFLRDMDFLEHLRSALAGKQGEIVLECVAKTYRIYFSHVSGGGAIIFFLDITERAKAEKMRREFSANVSHELKTPLTSIYGNAEMLYNGIVKNNDKIKFYNEIKNEAGRLITLIEDILMISKLDESSGQEFFEDVDLTAVAAETVQSLSQKAALNAITLQISSEKVIVKANRSLMYEMFYNLIDNAIKYNKPSGKVNINIKYIENKPRITISDTGIGIPKEAQNRVFERFFRVDKSRSKKTGGTGLGLAIVKHIVMVHEGTITLKSTENEGTIIIIRLF